MPASTRAIAPDGARGGTEGAEDVVVGGLAAHLPDQALADERDGGGCRGGAEEAPGERERSNGALGPSHVGGVDSEDGPGVLRQQVDEAVLHGRDVGVATAQHDVVHP